MNTLKMKIHGFEESSLSLLVSFASDATRSRNPDDYPKFAFQPSTMWPDVTDPEEIKKRIAIAGVWHAEQQAREEKVRVDAAQIERFKSMVGEEVQYAVSDIVPPPAVPESNVVVV